MAEYRFKTVNAIYVCIQIISKFYSFACLTSSNMLCSTNAAFSASSFFVGHMGIFRAIAANHVAFNDDLWDTNKLRWASESHRTPMTDRACSEAERGRAANASSVCRWCNENSYYHMNETALLRFVCNSPIRDETIGTLLNHFYSARRKTGNSR